MRIGQTVACIHCLSPDSYMVKLDCKGRPFGTCSMCGVRSFYRGHPSMKGEETLWGPLSAALRDGDVAAARVMVEQAVVANA